MSSENAVSPRIPLSVEIEFRKSYSRQGSPGLLKNVSLSGAFVETNDPKLEPNDKLQLWLTVGSRMRKINAEVIWKNITGVGVKFNHTNNRDLQIIDDLMYFAENKRLSQKGLLKDIFDKVS